MKVKNLNGTGEKIPQGYSSWLEFWEKKAGKKANVCSNMTCTGSAEVGGHVKLVGGTNKEYIVPICYSCNNKKDLEFESYYTPIAVKND